MTAGPDVLRLYLDQLGKFPLLTRTDEVRLGQAVQAAHAAREELGDSGHGLAPGHHRELRLAVVAGDQAMSQFVNSNLRLVVSIARKYQWSALPLLDLIQEGNLGLMRDVKKDEVEQNVAYRHKESPHKEGDRQVPLRLLNFTGNV
ncbi:MAG: sigma-70 factor domain-containing protein, partial [Acidimicrobiales bacterium]